MQPARVECSLEPCVSSVRAPPGDPREVLGDRKLGHVGDEPGREREFTECTGDVVLSALAARSDKTGRKWYG